MAPNIPSNVISRRLLGAFALTFVTSTPLFFLLILIHEGGYGLLLVPAIILNQGPPFTNSPLGIIMMILSIPLGNVAVGVTAGLAFKNVNRYEKSRNFSVMMSFTFFFSLFLITFTFFWLDLITGEDFALNFWEPLGLPLYANRPLQLIISLFSYVFFPAYLIIKRSFDTQLVVGISAGTGVGILVCINHIIPFIVPMLRYNLFLLVTIGLPIFLFSVCVLHRLSRYPPKI